MGFTGYHSFLVASAGSLLGAGLGVLLLTPSDGAAGMLITRWEQECDQLASVMADAQAKAAEHQKHL